MIALVSYAVATKAKEKYLKVDFVDPYIHTRVCIYDND